VKIERQAIKAEPAGPTLTPLALATTTDAAGTLWLMPSVSRSPPLWATLYQITLPKSGDGDVEITGLFDAVFVSQ
jgi:hypothetical protein